MSPARARTRTARSGVERKHHEATAPPTKKQLNTWIIFQYFAVSATESATFDLPGPKTSDDLPSRM